jgi:hypothetical protein
MWISSPATSEAMMLRQEKGTHITKHKDINIEKYTSMKM